MSDLIPEPAGPTAYVLIGGAVYQFLVIRDDVAASKLRRYGLPPEARWWRSDDGEADPVPWVRVLAPQPRGLLPRGVDRSEVLQLVPLSEAGLSVVGEHIIERGGYCRTDGSHHSPEEIARLEDRVAEERGSGA